MASTPEQGFCKKAACPSSDILLRYRRHRLPLNDRAAIEIHLRSCDFCSAELQLLTLHRVAAEYGRCAEMPDRLRRLAEDCLVRSRSSFVLLDNADGRRFAHSS